MTTGIDYTEEEWQQAAGHLPLGGLAKEDLLLLHRHWMWANQQREAFDRLLSNNTDNPPEPGPGMMATAEMGHMFVWYGLLWSVVEACVDPGEKRNLDIRDPLRADIDLMTDALRKCRNAVLHVPRSGALIDSRIESLVAENDSAVRLRRIHRGLGMLFLEELRRRNESSSVAAG